MGLMVLLPKTYEINRAHMGQLVAEKEWTSLSKFWRFFGYGKTGYHKAKTVNNWFIAIEAKHKDKPFVFSNYHMPCRFTVYLINKDPKLMNIHIALLAQATLKFAKGLPCMIVGDFNT